MVGRVGVSVAWQFEATVRRKSGVDQETAAAPTSNDRAIAIGNLKVAWRRFGHLVHKPQSAKCARRRDDDADKAMAPV